MCLCDIIDLEVIHLRVRLIDIAKKANVSVATVSMALNKDNPKVSKDKIAEIKKIAKEMNYIPNSLARGLVTQSTKTVGLIIPDIENAFFSSLVKRIEDSLRKAGYMTLITNSDEKFKNDMELIDLVAGRGIDGLMMAMSDESYTKVEEIMDKIQSINTPYLLFDRSYEKDNHAVFFDSHEGSYLATQHLIDLGHTRIGCITGAQVARYGFIRFSGYKDCLEDNNIAYDEKIVKEGDFKFQTGYDLTDSLIEQGISALFVANDMMAYGVIKRLREKNIKIPEDFSIVGYDNLPLSNLLDIPLTSVSQDVDVLANAAVENMLNLIQGKEMNERIILKPVLNVLNSTQKFK